MYILNTLYCGLSTTYMYKALTILRFVVAFFGGVVVVIVVFGLKRILFNDNGIIGVLKKL